jgi:DNA polymerase III sliding clamp (beta) subunit (PCNA family)
MEILYCVRIYATTCVVVETTDCEIGMRIEVDGCTVDATGEAVVLFARLKSLVSLLADDKVRMWKAGSTLHVECGGSLFELPCADPSKFPQVSATEGGLSITATASEIARCLRRTMPTCGAFRSHATEHVFFSLAIGLVNVYGTNCTNISWDGFQADIVGSKPATSILVTQKGCKALLAVLDESSGDVTLNVSDSSIAIVGPRFATARMAAGSWPTFFMGKFGMTAIEVPILCDVLERVLKQAEVTTSIDTSFADFEFSDGSLTIHSTGPSEGMALIEIPVPWDAPPAAFSLRPAAVLAFLRMREKGESVVVRVPNEGRDVQSPVGFECGTHKYLASVKERQ